MKLSPAARAAKNEYARKYREENRDKVREYAKKWREANPDKVRQHQHWEKKAREQEAR